MPLASSIFFSIALCLAVTLGPQTRAWSWGPSLIFLALAVAATIPSLIRGKGTIGLALLIFSLITASWFIGNALMSPVAELARADVLLIVATVGTFIVVGSLSDHQKAEGVLLWTISILVGASALVIAKQVQDPSFAPIFSNRAAQLPSGFYAHYNEGANFLLGTSFLLGGFSLFGPQNRITRFIWGSIAIGGLIAVYFTRSRGGILGAGIGTMVFFSAILLIGKRRDCRWFSPAAVVLPIFFIAACGFVYQGWASAQKLRFQEEVGAIMDGTVRLNLFGIAFSCINQHPWTGGGSRSFSWECNQFWNTLDHNAGHHRPEYVHNELLQAATDYGLIGFSFLVILVGWMVILGITRIYATTNSRITSSDAWVAGAIAGLAGMLVQSSFSFVFHLLPGVLLLGICLAKTSSPPSPLPANNATKSLLILSSVLCFLYLIPTAWNGSRTVKILWPVYFRPDPSLEERASNLSRALALWEESTLYKERAIALQRLASSNATESGNHYIALAIEDYRRSIGLHPYDTTARINLANLLSLNGDNQEATNEYLTAIELQGGMEPAYRAHYQFAEHLIREGWEHFKNREYEQSSSSFQTAASQFEKVIEQIPWLPNEERGFSLKLSVLQGLGASHEALGNIDEALSNYNAASLIIGGSGAHYRSAVLLGDLAKTAWSERRPAEALTRFQEARQRMELATELPASVTPEMKAEYVAFLDRSIQYLVEAKVEPLKKPEE